MSDVFISYESNDLDRVEVLVSELEASELSVWWDRNIGVGKDFENEISAELDQAKCVIVIWSETSIASNWVRDEAQEGLDRGILIPIVIDDCRPPLGFRRAQSLQWSGWPALERDVASLIRDIHQLIGRARPLSEATPAETKQGGLRRWLIPIVATTLVVAAGTGWWFLEQNRPQTWIQEEGMPAIEDAIAVDDFATAYALLERVEQLSPGHAALSELWPKISVKRSVNTFPPGASIAYKLLSDPDGVWVEIGTAPIETRHPQAPLRWRAVLDGYRPTEIINVGSNPLTIILLENEAGEDQVYIPSYELPRDASAQILSESVQLPGFLMDRLEVSNEDYLEFVNAGGYEEASYWQDMEITREGQVVTWQQAVETFVDKTGRKGPATWQLGAPPDGKLQHPVGGVSWYEAQAYASFRQKDLPTLYHWVLAAIPWHAPFMAIQRGES